MAERQSAPHGRPLWLWILTVLMIEIVCVLMLVSPTAMSGMLERERAMVAQHLGQAAEEEIRAGADAMFVTSVIETGFRDASYHQLLGFWDRGQAAADVPFDDRGAGKWVTGRLRVMWGVYYLLLYRLSALLAWLPWLAPLFGGAAVDGSMRWKASHWSFTFASPTIHRTGLSIMGLVVSGTFGVLVAPMRITPLWAPSFAIVAAIAMWLVIGNMSKRF